MCQMIFEFCRFASVHFPNDAHQTSSSSSIYIQIAQMCTPVSQSQSFDDLHTPRHKIFKEFHASFVSMRALCVCVCAV